MVVRGFGVEPATDEEDVGGLAQTRILGVPLEETSHVLDPVEARHRKKQRLVLVFERAAVRARRRAEHHLFDLASQLLCTARFGEGKEHAGIGAG